MNELKWIKIRIDMFDNRKIRHLRKLPDGNSIILVWVMLLTMAGRCNAGGMIFLTENIPYTTKMLADELGFEEAMIVLAINTFIQLNMISEDDEGFISITGWEEYQNIDGMERIREQTRQRVAKHRALKALMDNNVTCNVTVTQTNATEEDKELDIDIDKDIDIYIKSNLNKELSLNSNKDTLSSTPYQNIADLYNQLCPSFPRLTNLSEKRKKAIKARLRVYTVDDFRMLFLKAEASPFLKGSNDRNWSATFDWLIADSNMAKVLDGNYDERNSKPVSKKAQELNDFYSMAAAWAEGGNDEQI